jgi:RHS repeat-associated protein
MHPNANNIQTHQFNWNAWVEWMCKMKCYENLDGEVLGIWENHWNSRTEPFYNGTITCGYEECQGTYTSLLADWTENLNNEVIPQMQAHNFVSSCTIQKNVYVKGSRRYELSNHLGNVLAVVSDRKIESDEDYFYAGLGNGYKFENGVYIADFDGEYKQNGGPDGIISSYSAEVISANDYYAFGSLMPGRSFSGGEYKFGFNGKENDNEVKGEGNQQDYGMRIYETRLGKFLSVDPLSQSYPFYSPYQFAGNTSIMAIDLDGLETQVAIDGKTKKEGPYDMNFVNKSKEVQINVQISRALNSSIPVPNPIKNSTSVSIQPNKTENPKELKAKTPEPNKVATYTGFIGLGVDQFKNTIPKSNFTAFGLRTGNGYHLNEIRYGFAFRNEEKVIFKTDLVKGAKFLSYSLNGIGVLGDYYNYSSGASNGGEFSFSLIKTSIGLINLEASMSMLLLDQTKIGTELNALSRHVGILYSEMERNRNPIKYEGDIKPAKLIPAR